jgi:hypothetical protein
VRGLVHQPPRPRTKAPPAVAAACASHRHDPNPTLNHSRRVINAILDTRY